MSTKEWGQGYDEGYMKGWNDAMAEQPAPATELREQEPVAIDWGAVHEKLCEVWQREISADEGLDEIQDLVVAATPPAQQEPVAWICEGSSSDEKHAIDYWPGDVDDLPIGTKLYASLPAPCKPLTPWTEAQHERAYRNSPELHKDVKSLAAFKRVAKKIAAMYGIKGEA